MDRHQLSQATSTPEIQAAVSTWLDEQVALLTPPQPLGQWLITKEHGQLSPIEVLEETLALALSGEDCNYPFDATQLALFRVPCGNDQGEGISWTVYSGAARRTIHVTCSYFDEGTGRDEDVTFRITVDEATLDKAFAAGTTAAVEALRDALADLVAEIRDNLHQLPVGAAV